MNKKFTGAITAIVTPFQENGQVDIEALKNFVEFQIENNIDGIVVCGSTGEAATMNAEEMKLVIKTVVEQANHRVPIIAGAGSNDTHKAIEFSRIGKEAGADGLLHVTPYYNKPTPKGLVAHFKAIAETTELPIILYNVPGRTASNVSAETTLRIANEISQVVGVKEASGNILQIMDIIKDAPEGFSVLSGDDSLTFSVMAGGGDGVISVASNEIPGQFASLIRAALAGRWDEARKLHYEWIDLMNVNFIETNPQPVKTALAMMGKMKEVFRLPLVSMEDKNKYVLKEVLAKHKLI